MLHQRLQDQKQVVVATNDEAEELQKNLKIKIKQPVDSKFALDF